MTDVLDPATDHLSFGEQVAEPTFECEHCGATAGDNGKPFHNLRSLAVHRQHKHPDRTTPPQSPAGDQAAHLAAEPPPPPEEPPVETQRSKLRRLLGLGPAPEKAQKAPKSPRAKPLGLGRRKPADDLLEGLWGAGGSLLAQTGIDIPVGRVMTFQAPAAGIILDKAIAGTLPDRFLLQPIVRKKDEAEALGALLGLPAVVFLMERNPTAAQTLMPLLRMALEANFVPMAQAAARQKKRAEANRKAMAELFPDMPAGADPIGDIIEQIFAPPPNYQAQPEPEPASANGSTGG